MTNISHKLRPLWAVVILFAAAFVQPLTCRPATGQESPQAEKKSEAAPRSVDPAQAAAMEAAKAKAGTPGAGDKPKIGPDGKPIPPEGD